MDKNKPALGYIVVVLGGDGEAAPQGVLVEKLDGVGDGEEHSNNNPCVVLLFFLPAFGWCPALTVGRFFSIFFT